MVYFDDSHLPKFEGIFYRFYSNELPNSSHKYIIKDTEDEVVIRENKNILQQHLPVEKISLTKQIHSNKVLIENGRLEHQLEGDGLVTKESNIALLVQTADCIPILFADLEGRIIAAAHSGWKGAIGGIITNTMGEMIKLGAENIIAILGPYIKQDDYEVGEEFYQNFLSQNKNYAIFFLRLDNKIYFDLGAFVKYHLKELGVKQIYDIGINTYRNGRCFSYRRFTQGKTKQYGSLISAIALI